MPWLTGWNVILTLKVAVTAVTVILLFSFVALVRGRYRLHGRINTVFAALTLAALLALELVVRVIEPNVFDYFDQDTSRSLSIHLGFAVPAALLLPVMLFTGFTHRRSVHLFLAGIFGILWTGTVITGVFWLPHTPPL
jgi:hypothetical protein